MTAELLFDGLLCSFLIGLVWKLLTVRELYQAAIFFIALGLSMAVAWARLAAPDVALAEAAIGAGLLGVLLIDSLRVFAPGADVNDLEGGCSTGSRLSAGLKVGDKRKDHFTSNAVGRRFSFIGLLVFCAGLVFMAVLVSAVIRMPDGGGLTRTVEAAMPESGVEHGVTAVLLNFRSYDTWLEVGVLVLAMFGLFVVQGESTNSERRRMVRPDVLLDWLVRGLVPLLVLAAGYLLWLGKFAPGGAFQSGVVLGAAVILLRLNGFRLLERLPSWAWKGALVLGFVAFIGHGIGALLWGRAFLEFPPGQASGWILGLEILAALSIAFTLAAFFVRLHDADRASNAVFEPEEAAN